MTNWSKLRKTVADRGAWRAKTKQQRRERNVEIEKKQSRNNSTTMGQGLDSSSRITQKQSL